MTITKAIVSVDAANYTNMEISLKKRSDKDFFHQDLELIIKEWSSEQRFDLERIWYTGEYPNCPAYDITPRLESHDWIIKTMKAIYNPVKHKYEANVDGMITDDIKRLPNLRSRDHKHLIVLLTGDKSIIGSVVEQVCVNKRNKVLLITTLRELDDAGIKINGRASYTIQRILRKYPNFTFMDYEDLVDAGKIRLFRKNHMQSRSTTENKIRVESI